MGDEIRKILAGHNSSPIYQAVFEVMNKGRLINDGIVWAVLNNKLSQLDTSSGFLLDGYPRNIEQALIMEICEFKYDIVVNLKQDEEVIITKLLGRRVCESCGTNFNIAEVNFNGYNLPPRKPIKENICDKCNGKLTVRKDDLRETIEKRLLDYKNYTLPLEDYFKKQNKLLDFTAFEGVSDYPKLLVQIKERLNMN